MWLILGLDQQKAMDPKLLKRGSRIMKGLYLRTVSHQTETFIMVTSLTRLVWWQGGTWTLNFRSEHINTSARAKYDIVILLTFSKTLWHPDPQHSDGSVHKSTGQHEDPQPGDPNYGEAAWGLSLPILSRLTILPVWAKEPSGSGSTSPRLANWSAICIFNFCPCCTRYNSQDCCGWQLFWFS